MLVDKDPKILLLTSTAEDGNMSCLRGDINQALQNRRRFLQQFNIDLKQVVCMSCQHKTDILFVGKNDLGKGVLIVDNAPKVDGLVTKEKNVYLFLLTADCIPLSIYDPINQAVGLIHCSRINLSLGIINQAIQSFQKHFGSDPANLLVEIGPSIGPCCYKLDYPYTSGKVLETYVKKLSNKEFSLDLWKFCEYQLIEGGVPSRNIFNQKICTYHNDRYFSHRRVEVNKEKNDFRFTTILGIKV